MNARELLTGKTIRAIRPMTQEELEREGWPTAGDHGQQVMCIEVDIGTDEPVTLFPSRDSEGNGPGVMFGFGCGDAFYL